MSFEKPLVRVIWSFIGGIIITAFIGFLLSFTSEKNFSFIPVQMILFCIIWFEFKYLPILTEFKKSTIVKETFIHFIMGSGFFLIMAVLATWVKVRSAAFLILVLDCVLIYLSIWLMEYITLKQKIQKINQKLQKK